MTSSTDCSDFARLTGRALLLVFLLQVILCLPAALAQPSTDDTLADVEAGADDSTDALIATRIRRVYALLEPLTNVEVEVRAGVVLLSGPVSNQAQAERAVSLASQIPGVLTVDDGMDRRLDVRGNLSPMLDGIRSDLNQWTRALPLVALALLIFAGIVLLGYRLARWSTFWRKLTANPFLAELCAQAVRVLAVVIGLVVALNLLGATALMATILGGAGVVGLAIGFAVRDSMENYISSIMLSLRQPFRANDHVVINDFEGKVVRLTSRATVLMTLDGNQLRIPNAMVFKAVILNYTRNPQRRFAFKLGVDSSDDAVSAMKVGVDTIKVLPFVLAEPAANAVIDTVGDSNTVLMFTGWIDQRATDFGRARSLAIHAVTRTLDEQGFTMPEPIYRLRFDSQQNPQTLSDALSVPVPEPVSGPGDNDTEASGTKQGKALPLIRSETDDSMDVSPDTHIEGMVNEERALENTSDLLDDSRPVE